MSDVFTPVSASTHDNYVAIATATTPNLMTVMVFGIKSKKCVTKFEVTPESAMAFEEAVVDIFDGKCQAIIFHIFNFKPLGYPHVTKFAYEIRCKLGDNKIYHYFYSGQSLFLSGLLIAAKIKPTKNDILLYVRVRGERLAITEYIFTDFGYDCIREDVIQKAEDETAGDLRERILHGKKPKHIIVFGESTEMPIMKKLKKSVFSHEKIHRLDNNALKESIAHTLKISKYVRDRKYVKYHVIPKCAKDFAVYLGNCETPYFTIKAGESIPCTMTEYAFRDPFNMVVCGYDDITLEKRLIYIYNKEDCQKRHRSKLVFHVDGESFPIVRSLPVLVDIIQELPTTLENTLSKKIPLIAFCDSYSVICAVKEGQKRYSFLDGWNGIYGHDASMYANNLHRFVGLEATNMKREDPIHGLSNLIQLMSNNFLDKSNDPAFMELANGVPSEKCEDREDVVCFYMTKFLEEHFKVIRNETGKKVDEVAFWLVFKDVEVFKSRLIDCFRHFIIHFHFFQLEVPE